MLGGGCRQTPVHPSRRSCCARGTCKSRRLLRLGAFPQLVASSSLGLSALAGGQQHPVAVVAALQQELGSHLLQQRSELTQGPAALPLPTAPFRWAALSQVGAAAPASSRRVFSCDGSLPRPGFSGAPNQKRRPPGRSGRGGFQVMPHARLLRALQRVTGCAGWASSGVGSSSRACLSPGGNNRHGRSANSATRWLTTTWPKWKASPPTLRQPPIGVFHGKDMGVAAARSWAIA